MSLVDSLLSEFTDELIAGKKPLKYKYLIKCTPATMEERAELVELMETTELLYRNRDVLKDAVKSNYCPTCQAVVLEEGMCECCRLAMEKMVEKKLGGVRGATLGK